MLNRVSVVLALVLVGSIGAAGASGRPVPFRGPDSRECGVAGACVDVILVIDVSSPTGDSIPSGPAQIEGTGGASILATQIAASREFVASLDAAHVAVGVVAFSGDPPDLQWQREPRPAWTEAALTTDHRVVVRALARVEKRGPQRMTHTGAGIDRSTIELLGLEGAASDADPDVRKVMVLMTNGNPTLPFGPGFQPENLKATLMAAGRARHAGVEMYVIEVSSEEPGSLRLALEETVAASGGAFSEASGPGGLAERLGSASASVAAAVARGAGRTLSAPTAADLERLAAQRRVVARLFEEHLRLPLECCDLEMLDGLQHLLDRGILDASETYGLQSMGVVFGDLLSANTSLEWAIVSDARGRDPCLRVRDTPKLIFPLTIISKRVEDREVVDVRSLYASGVRFAEKWGGGGAP